MKQFILHIILLIALFTGASAQQQEVPYTLEDRDRSIRTEANIVGLEAKMEALEAKMEAKIEALETKMDIKFDSQQQQINDLKTMFFWGFGIMITLMIFMLGYTIYDRRTAMHPIREKADRTENNLQSLIRALREKAQNDDQLAQILRSHGLL